MENVSQLIRRNLPHMPAGNISLVNPAPDDLFRELLAPDRTIRLSTSSFGDFLKLDAMGADVVFEPVSDPGRGADFMVMVLPREKDKLSMLLHAASNQLAPDGRLWLVGAIRAGIKSAPRFLEKAFMQVGKLDNARHCVLFEASGPRTLVPFSLDAYETRWTHGRGDTAVKLVSLPGVFAHGRLDRGTEMLLGAIRDVHPEGRILDFASGCGVIGISILHSVRDTSLVLLDDSALAIESGIRSLRVNGMEAQSLPSDGLSELEGTFDWIVSNPPFHRGISNDLDIAANFFRRAGTFLAEKGKILIVFNRHLPYIGWLRRSFKNVDCLAQDREFTVIQASKKI